jgi:hypothetical protein
MIPSSEPIPAYWGRKFERRSKAHHQLPRKPATAAPDTSSAGSKTRIISAETPQESGYRPTDRLARVFLNEVLGLKW